MKQIRSIKTLNWLLLLTVFSFSGCLLPYNPYERAAVVIFNDTDTAFNYQLELSARWSTLAQIAPKQFDYVLVYDQIDKRDEIDNQLTKIKLISINCKITLHRQDILKHLTKDPEGRNTWDLHVNKLLLKQFACH